MAWVVKLYQSIRGEKPIEKFIKSCESPTVAKILHHLNLLEKHGPILGMPHTKKLSSNLYELRIRGKQEIRIIYTFVGKNIYLLHIFKKQTQKTPSKEITISLNRIQELKIDNT